TRSPEGRERELAPRRRSPPSTALGASGCARAYARAGLVFYPAAVCRQSRPEATRSGGLIPIGTSSETDRLSADRNPKPCRPRTARTTPAVVSGFPFGSPASLSRRLDRMGRATRSEEYPKAKAKRGCDHRESGRREGRFPTAG